MSCRHFLLVAACFLVVPDTCIASPPGVVAINHTYEARIRLDGKVSTTTVQASDAGQAKKLVQAQFGPKVTVLSVKRID
jgi:hypothetical protein